MFMCVHTATLVKCIHTPAGDEYDLVPLNGVSWHAKSHLLPDGQGAAFGKSVVVRVPADAVPEGVFLELGDILVRGERTQAVTRPSDLAEHEWFTIQTVGDNQRGQFPHFVLRGV